MSLTQCARSGDHPGRRRLAGGPPLPAGHFNRARGRIAPGRTPDAVTGVSARPRVASRAPSGPSFPGWRPAARAWRGGPLHPPAGAPSPRPEALFIRAERGLARRQAGGMMRCRLHVGPRGSSL